jgi:hypothetical protein
MSIRFGRAAFTAAWLGGSYNPLGTMTADSLSYYASKFDKVEGDSILCHSPSM